MSSVTSVSNPSLFASATNTLPAGFHYILQSTGMYAYGQKNNIYQVGIVREADNIIIWGAQFYPYDGFPDPMSMIGTECDNTYEIWYSFYLADQRTLAAQALIGF